MPQILHVHAKFYDIDENGQEPAIDYPELVRVFVEGGYRGYWSSEWEGHAFAELGEVDPLLLVRKQHDLIRARCVRCRPPEPTLGSGGMGVGLDDAAGLDEELAHPGVLGVAAVHRMPPQRVDERRRVERQADDANARRARCAIGASAACTRPMRVVPATNSGSDRKLSTTTSTCGSTPSCWTCRSADVNAERDW